MRTPTRSQSGRASCSKAAAVFGGESRPEPAAPSLDLKSLHAKIGQLALENDF